MQIDAAISCHHSLHAGARLSLSFDVIYLHWSLLCLFFFSSFIHTPWKKENIVVFQTKRGLVFYSYIRNWDAYWLFCLVFCTLFFVLVSF